MASKEAPLQYDMFTGELVDTRSRRQKKRDRQRDLPQQTTMFSTQDVIQQARSRYTQPFMVARNGKPLSLALMMEDSRTEEEIERDLQREAERQTVPMFNMEDGQVSPNELAIDLYAQYDDIKRQYPQAIVLFSQGDFYETYNGDAEIAAQELGLVLTSRKIEDFKVKMAGVPHDRVEESIAQLVEKGYSVALCEPVPDEDNNNTRRDVTRVFNTADLEDGEVVWWLTLSE